MAKCLPLMALNVLYEDNHLLVVNKPAGVVTQGAAEGQPSIVDQAKDYLRTKYNKPGNVYLGIVSRLDKLTTAALVLARTSKAAARLTKAFKDRTVSKTYLALIPPTELPHQGTIENTSVRTMPLVEWKSARPKLIMPNKLSYTLNC